MINSKLFAKGTLTQQPSLSNVLENHVQVIIRKIKDISNIDQMTDSFLERIVKESLVETATTRVRSEPLPIVWLQAIEWVLPATAEALDLSRVIAAEADEIIPITIRSSSRPRNPAANTLKTHTWGGFPEKLVVFIDGLSLSGCSIGTGDLCRFDFDGLTDTSRRRGLTANLTVSSRGLF